MARDTRSPSPVGSPYSSSKRSRRNEDHYDRDRRDGGRGYYRSRSPEVRILPTGITKRTYPKCSANNSILQRRRDRDRGRDRDGYRRRDRSIDRRDGYRDDSRDEDSSYRPTRRQRSRERDDGRDYRRRSRDREQRSKRDDSRDRRRRREDSADSRNTPRRDDSGDHVSQKSSGVKSKEVSFSPYTLTV